MNNIRQKIFEIIETSEKNGKAGRAYDIFMMVVIVASLIPLTLKDSSLFTRILDRTTVTIFIIDYFLRLITADLKLKRGKTSFALYPVTPMAIIDLVSIMPSISIINETFKLLRVLRLLRALRVFKLFRYSKSISMIVSVFRRQKEPLIAVGGFAAGYILISALIVFNAEPGTFSKFFDAVYWATISLTTVGYGDIYLTSDIGRVISMITSVFGIAIVALPAGIVTAGYMDELKKKNKETISQKNV